MPPGWLEHFYDEYPRIEEGFQTALEGSLQPRGPELLYDLVGNLGLSPGSLVIDVGCGEGKHSLRLAERFQFTVTGLDPVARHIELANTGLAALTARHPEIGGRVSFALGTAETLPFESRTVDLIWCRDVLVHIADLDVAYAEFARVLRANGRVLLYQTFGTDRLEPGEAKWLWGTMGVVPTSVVSARVDAAISAAGLQIDDCIDLRGEWDECAEEQSGRNGQRLLHASRLLRDPQRYIAGFGETAYEIMLGDCLWHVYAMIGKLDHRVYLLSKT